MKKTMIATAEEIEVHFIANQLRALASTFDPIDAPTATKQSSSERSWQNVLHKAADKLDSQAALIDYVNKDKK